MLVLFLLVLVVMVAVVVVVVEPVVVVVVYIVVVVVEAGKYDQSNNFNIRDVIDVVRGFFNGTAADTEWKLFVV